MQPHSAATESRLSLVINAVVRLDQETDTNVSRPIDALEAEKAKIERQIIDIHQGKSRVLGNDAAIERAREIISLADGLADFAVLIGNVAGVLAIDHALPSARATWPESARIQ